jgi:hypothetical protein
MCSIEFTDVEKTRQRRSRIVQTLNVPQRVRFGSSLAAASLNGLFEHPFIYFNEFAPWPCLSWGIQ